MVKLYTTEEQRGYRHRYKLNDLYRQWSPILSMLQRECGEMDEITLWSLAERQILRLREEKSFREQEISPIFNELLADCKVFTQKGKKDVERSDVEAKRSATTVMCIVLTMLMNAVEKGHEDEAFDNEPMCTAILDVFMKDSYFKQLMDLFFERKKGYDGQKVVITPSDPMKPDSTLADMDEVAKAEMEAMVENVLNRTQGLKTLFKKHWDVWPKIWKDICLDTELMDLLNEVKPRSNEWGMNMMMVLNVAGMFKSIFKLDVSDNSINELVSDKARRPYIAQHADYDGTNSAFNRELYGRVKSIIENYYLSTQDK